LWKINEPENSILLPGELLSSTKAVQSTSSSPHPLPSPDGVIYEGIEQENVVGVIFPY